MGHVGVSGVVGALGSGCRGLCLLMRCVSVGCGPVCRPHEPVARGACCRMHAVGLWLWVCVCLWHAGHAAGRKLRAACRDVLAQAPRRRWSRLVAGGECGSPYAILVYDSPTL